MRARIASEADRGAAESSSRHPRGLYSGTVEQVSAELKGPARIAAYLKTLPDAPGVYRMIDAKGDVLYVGKAKSLKKRVAAYASGRPHAERLTRMIQETAGEVFVR